MAQQTNPRTTTEAEAAKVARARTKLRITVGIIIILLSGLGGLAIATIRAEVEKRQEVVEVTQEAPATRPYFYDEVLDQHWHPGHQHWHQGPVPPGVDPDNPFAIQSDGVEAPPGVSNPEPWQYHEQSNRHFDPNHGHWHTGPAPAEGARGQTALSDAVPPPPNITNPEPWQYDPTSNKYFHPGHAHWHAGKPPEVGDR